MGVASLLPKTFESVAILNVIDQLEKVASLATSATVMDPVAEQIGLTKSATKDAAGAELRERVSMAVGRKDGLLTLTTKGESGGEARALANVVLARLFIAVAPKGQDAADLEKSLSLARPLYAKYANDGRSLRGLTEASLAQTLKLSAQRVAPKRSQISVLAALATGFALLLFAFIRRALTNAAIGEAVSGSCRSRLRCSV